MSADKDILALNSHGDWEFTPYGEFISYYHAHLQLFTGIIKRKNLAPAETDKLVKQLSAFMKQNVKKVDHFFENMKVFAEMVGYTEETLNTFMQKNFMKALSQVQEQLKKQESKKEQAEPEASFDQITDEIVKELKFSLGEGLKFTTVENRVVLENTIDGTIQEPVGPMSIAEHQAAKAGAAAAEVSEPVVIEKEKLILDEIIQGFGEYLTGQKLEIIEDISPDDISTIDDPDALPIDDIEFEDDSHEEEYQPHEDISDILGLMDDTEEVQEPEEDEADKYTYPEFNSLLGKINAFMVKKDTAGYSQWMATIPDVEKSIISIRNALLKEGKGEAVDWNSFLNGIAGKTGITSGTLEKLKDKTADFQKFKTNLEMTARKLGSNPELAQLVKMAWPHIQKASVQYPDREQVRTELQSLFKKIQNQSQREQLEKPFIALLNR